MTLMESLRVRVGLTKDDTSKDDEITFAKDTSFALMGSYCDRIFILMTDAVETFTHSKGMGLLLTRYPVESVSTIIDDKGTEFTEYHVDAVAGVVMLDYYWAFHTVSVTYTGGYDENALPLDLQAAFYSVFDQEYALATGGAVVSSGAIESVTVVDVGTVRYSNPSSTAQSAEGAFLPDRAKSILDDYKRYKC